MPKVAVFTAPLHGRKLTPAAWTRVEQLLDEWKATVLSAAKRHPARSYRLGVEQIEAYADLLTGLRTATAETAFGGVSPKMTHAAEWSRTYTLHELDDALNVYVGKIKDALLYGLRSGMNPVAIAQMLYKATGDASINWRMIARTEMARANAIGRLKAIQDMGYDRVWCPPHIGSCKSCQRLIENQVFDLEQVLNATNYGKPQGEWVPCIPLHPQCRHTWLPYDPEVHGLAMEQYRAMEDAGLMDEDRLEAMFDSSGQLRPEYAHVDLSAAKTAGGNMTGKYAGNYFPLDPYAEGLAVVIELVRKRRRGDAAFVEQELPAEDLRTDLYQRAMDPDKVLGMVHALRRGEDLPKPEVSVRDDGTAWVLDGQHRVEARKLAGEVTIRCDVRHGLSWDEESERCRAAIAKTWNAWAAALPELPDPLEVIAKATTLDAMLEAQDQLDEPDAEVPALNPSVFDGARLRDDVGLALDSWWSHVAGDDWRAFSHVRVPGDGRRVHVAVDYPALRVARKAWAKLADEDLHFALIAAARNAGSGVAELAPGIPMDLRIEPDQLLHADTGVGLWHLGSQSWDTGAPPAGAVEKSMTDVLPDYRWDGAVARDAEARLLGSDEYEAWVGKTTDHFGWHVAPRAARDAIAEHGLVEAQPNERWARYGAAIEPAGVYVWTSRARAMKWARDMARLVGGSELAVNDVWRVDLDGLSGQEHTDPVLGEQGAIYLTVPSVPAARLQLEAPDVAKSSEPAAGAGVEHWITVHPHGPGAEGQPVLVRNNADGTMSVIGGAGGNLNYLRLDPSRRVDRPEGAKAAPKSIEQPVSEEEADRAQAEREQELERARGLLTETQARKGEADQRLRDFARDELGVDLEGADVDPRMRRNLLAKLRVSALQTLTYGEVQARDRADGVEPAGAGAPRTDDELAEQQHQVESDASPEAEDGIERPQRPSMAMSAEQAAALLDHFNDLRAIQRVASQHRKVIAGEKPPSDANQIDWSLGGEAARDERRAKALDSFARTELAKDLLEGGDRQFKGKKGYDARYRSSFLQGGYDSIDSFSHSILGHNLLSRAAHDLLGVAGAAQLAAHAIQSEAMAKGKKALDLEKVGKALKDLTDDQERAIADRGIGRIKKATELAATAQIELAKSEAGNGLFTTTMARSMASEKIQEAKRGLGMMIGGLEACSALKMALARPTGEKIKVGGFSTPSQAKEAAGKAGVKLRADEIVRVGSGNYTLNIRPDRLMGLVRPDKQADPELRQRLRSIRTGDGLADEIQSARSTPRMADTLDSNQAKGKLALLAAGSHILGFDPGVGKTHTAIAAALERMHAEPDAGHRALIVVPTNMLGSWQNTIQAQDPSLKVSVVGRHRESKKRKLGQLKDPDAHFTVVSYETLKGYRGELQDATTRGEHVPHSIVIADELQKAKNEKTANHQGVETAVDLAVAHHGPSQPDAKGASFWGLTGTPIEKDVNDLNTMTNMVRRAKGGETTDRKTAQRKYGKLGQNEHVARGDKIAQFRDGLDADVFRLAAGDAGNDLGEPKRDEHKTPLAPDHEAEFKRRVNAINEQIADYHRRKASGELRTGKDGKPEKPIAFGGRDALMDALYGREDSSLVRGCADQIEKTGTFKFGGMTEDHEDGEYAKGDHAGVYEHKHVVFGANETSRALFGRKDDGSNSYDPKAKGGLAAELRKRGVKVFIGHGGMSPDENEGNYTAFLAHKGKAVFLTNDKNNAGISLQFGDNKGAFQHGATHMHHFTRPVNNATIQQREARILRKGAMAGAHYHTYNAGTPLEMRLQETLEREARTQDLAANAEQRVSGSETLRHKLAERGVKAGAA